MGPSVGELHPSECRSAGVSYSRSALRTLEIGAARVPDKSRVDPIDRTKEVHLADVDAVVAEDRVRHRDMEIDVWDRHLQQVVLATKHLASRRPGEADLPLGGAGVLRLGYTLRECDGFPDPGACLIDGPLVVLMSGRCLSGESQAAPALT